ncbi:IS91 family transposase [Alkalimarinus coralli]|uniref:IS91 family transposase n=1 Tax=Alkalimarinus coralli TaxID=2935863 RepID=UPI00202B63D4|nr:transposase [Alkalimarinus coralli]
MITLAQIMRDHQDALTQCYGPMMSRQHHHAMQSIIDCHTPACGEVEFHCAPCSQQQRFCHSCGHRSCPACQHQTNNQWLDRQRQKLLPVDYYMVTFTLPTQLRHFVWHHQKWGYQTLFNVARQTLSTFAKNDKQLHADLGLTGVLHTHSRRLEFHPHVHFIVPNGGLDKNKVSWRQKSGKYLFNGKSLAKVFRAKFIDAMKQQGFCLPQNTPQAWVTQCEHVGQGESAFVYLARYLYRGVISEKNITRYEQGRVTFKYQENKSKQWLTRTEPATEFLWLVLQHVLPKGFRRARDYGFLHSNAKQTLKRLQLILQAKVPDIAINKKRAHRCPSCGLSMAVIQFFKPKRFTQPTS